jgi:hypothetical protein
MILSWVDIIVFFSQDVDIVCVDFAFTLQG